MTVPADDQIAEETNHPKDLVSHSPILALNRATHLSVCACVVCDSICPI